MYTQCPDCSTAFRVTAEVLKQAAGKVRCGGCGNAFNALAYLSESMPERYDPPETDEALPELRPDSVPDDELPKSISAEQSAALLKTLDQLAGSDIRIEDTGVEWRVLDDEVESGTADEFLIEEPRVVDVRQELEIDEILDESPTPVDQFLTRTPAVVDAPEIFEEPASEPARSPLDEIRFDDNTPLPDDFDLENDQVEDEITATAAHPEPELETEPGKDIEQESLDDLDLSEPDEWTDILGEFDDLDDIVAASAEEDLQEPEEVVAEVTPTEIEAVETAPPVDHDLEEAPPIEDGSDELVDLDTKFAAQAEAMGVDLSGMHESLDLEMEPALDAEIDLDELLDDSSDAIPEIVDILDEGIVEETEELDEPDDVPAEQTQLDLIDDDDIESIDEVIDDELEEEVPEEPAEETLEAADQEEPEEEALEPATDERPDDNTLEAAIDEEPDDDLLDAAMEEKPEEADTPKDDGIFVPPMTEEEQTINLQIDQELLALAVEDEDGFASTIVVPEAAAQDESHGDLEGNGGTGTANTLKDTSSGFETIIMEGEAFRTTEDLNKMETQSVPSVVPSSSDDAEGTTILPPNAGRRRYGIIGGVVALVLLLVVQFVHQKRDTLATIPAFNNTVGPMYRALGKPLAPEWDIKGWRFEVAKGTEDSDRNLTIYSRLGNKSEMPLPYPIISVSLTDRFEETIGSQILDPGEYLAGNLDPRKLVDPGNTFEAVIKIPSPAIATPSFRLRACYRATDGQLRCKDDGFK